MTESYKGSPYWQEIREGLFVHNEDWDKTIERIPELLSANLVSSKLQSVDQLLGSGLRGTGSVGHRFIEVRPESDKLLPLLSDDYLPVENLFLQWVYSFFVVEAIAHVYPRTVPLAQWDKMYVNILDEGLHFMTYLAALIYLYEKSELKAIVTKSSFQSTEFMVQDEVRELTSMLYSKCAEYGESFRKHSLQGTLPRLWDKIARYAQLSALGRTAEYEPKLDSAKDLLGYCIIAWSLIKELDYEKDTEESL